MKKAIIILCLTAFLNLNIYPAFCASSVKVNADTSIPIELTETATSKSHLPGDKLQCEISRNIFINNVKVFSQGSSAYLNVSYSEKARFWGEGGKIFIADGYVRDVKGNMHKITYTKRIHGNDKNFAKVCGLLGFILFPFYFFAFVKGEEAKFYSHKPFDVLLTDGFTFVESL